MTTDTSEKGLESLIVAAMTGRCRRRLRRWPMQPRTSAVSTLSAQLAGKAGFSATHRLRPRVCVDLVQLRAFLLSTQQDAAEALDLDQDSPTRRKFLARLQGEISKRGVIDVLRQGIKHGPHHVDLFYGTPSPGNAKARRALRRRTASASPASSATAATRRSSRSTSASSSTACRSPRSS